MNAPHQEFECPICKTLWLDPSDALRCKAGHNYSNACASHRHNACQWAGCQCPHHTFDTSKARRSAGTQKTAADICPDRAGGHRFIDCGDQPPATCTCGATQK